MANPKHIAEILYGEGSLLHFIPKKYTKEEEEKKNKDKGSKDDRINNSDDDVDLGDQEAA